MLRLPLPVCRALAFQRSFSSTQWTASGHNKWSKIKDRKGALDAKRSAIYGKANKDIAVAARTGGSPDPEVNATLAAVIKKVKDAGVPKDNIERALAKARGGGGKGSQGLTYEVMAHGTVGVIIECLTDNTNRTSRAVKEILNNKNSRLAPVGFMFQRRGCVRVSFPASETSAGRIEQLLDEALGAEAEDFEQSETADGATEIEFTCPTQALKTLTDAVTSSTANPELLSSELIYSPLEEAEEPSEELEGNITDLVETLEENEDCLRVWTSLD